MFGKLVFATRPGELVFTSGPGELIFASRPGEQVFAGRPGELGSPIDLANYDCHWAWKTGSPVGLASSDHYSGSRVKSWNN